MNTIRNLFKNLFWRFLLLFILFYIIPYDLGYSITEAHYDLTIWDKPIMWIGETFYGWEFDLDRLYKGFDSKFEFCRYIFVFFVAAIGTLIWLLIDRYLKKEYTNKLKILTQTILRFHLGLTLLDYGLSKVFMLQFGTIGIDSLDQPIGNFVGMGLMWTFLSYSKLLVMVSGWLEFIGGVLLLFRKTTFLGALILIVVMTNVVLMNISYGVTVTMYASLLLCLLIVLISTQLKNLFAYLVLHKKTQAKAYEPLIKSKKARIIFKVLLFSVIGYFHFQNYSERIEEETSNRYAWFTNTQTVETFVMNGDTLSLEENKNNSKIWKKMSFNGFSYYPESFESTSVDEKNERFKFEIDSTTQKLRFRPYFNDSINWNEFTYKKIDKRKYTFKGIYKGDTIFMQTKAKFLTDYNLIYYRGKLLFDDY